MANIYISNSFLVCTVEETGVCSVKQVEPPETLHPKVNVSASHLRAWAVSGAPHQFLSQLQPPRILCLELALFRSFMQCLLTGNWCVSAKSLQSCLDSLRSCGL